MPTTGIGKKVWVIPGGHIPLQSTGQEPEFTSHDKISLLNTNAGQAQVQLTVYYPDEEPQQGYRCQVPGKRVRKIRINELIDPLPVFLDRPYALVIRSDVPLVVQFSRQSTAHANHALAGTMAYPVEQHLT
jgi:hypothetical protein